MSFSVVKKMEDILNDSASLLPEDKVNELRRKFDERRNQDKVKLLLYGPYNSGKTTLINALAGEELFAMGPTPETDRLQSKTFGEYEIIDSPGFNAPTQELDRLSKQAAMEKADVVLMVTDTENMEEDLLWNYIKELAKENKYLAIILNRKEEVGEEIEERIKKRISVVLKDMMKENLKPRIEGPFIVNAKSALKARMSKPIKKILEEKSGILELEDWIRSSVRMLGKLNGMDAFARDFLSVLQKVQEDLESKLDPETGYLKKTLKEIDEVQKEIFKELDNDAEERKNRLRQLIHKQVWSETFSGDDLKEILQQEIMAMSGETLLALDAKLMQVYEHHETEDKELYDDLKRRLDLNNLNFEHEPSDITEGSAVERETPQEIDNYENRGPGVLYSRVARMMVDDMEKRGYLKYLERKGAKNIFEKVGLKKLSMSKKIVRSLPAMLRTLPYILIAIDVGRTVYQQREQLKEQKEAVRRQLEEYNRKIEEMKNTTAETIGYKVNLIFENSKAHIRRYILKELASIKKEVRGKISTTKVQDESLKAQLRVISELEDRVKEVIA